MQPILFEHNERKAFVYAFTEISHKKVRYPTVWILLHLNRQIKADVVVDEVCMRSLREDLRLFYLMPYTEINPFRLAGKYYDI